MSVLRCDKHDRNYDTDYVEQCPRCLDEEAHDMPRPCFACGEYQINGCTHDDCPTRIV